YLRPKAQRWEHSLPEFLQKTAEIRPSEPVAVRLAEAVPAESVRLERKATAEQFIWLFAEHLPIHQMCVRAVESSQFTLGTWRFCKTFDKMESIYKTLEEFSVAEQRKTFYITTPIYYPSGKFHIGTAYTTI